MIALHDAQERGAALAPDRGKECEVADEDMDVVDEVEDSEDAEEILSAKEVAKMFGTDARTFRKFLRSIIAEEDRPGQGSRWEIWPSEVPELRDRFETWSKPSKNGGKKVKVKIEDDEVVDLADDEDLVDEDISDDDEAVDLEDIEIVD
jgi:hypothetical protein